MSPPPLAGQVDDVIIVGAGQGGLSVSWFLTQAGIRHCVLEKGDIGNAWASDRWESFCLVTPNWSINLPGKPYIGDDPDGFMPRDAFVTYLKEWAHGFGAPVETGIEVTHIARDGGLFLLSTNHGPRWARNVVIATATYQHPKVPAVASKMPADVIQLHARSYKSPEMTGPGAVLVVGSGQTGCQIVEDCLRAGRKVYLCVSRTGRLPRRYRGKDIIEWQRDMGTLDRTPEMLESPADRFLGDPHLTGRDGGSTVSMRAFQDRGATLLGKLTSVEGRCLSFAADLSANLAYADAFAKKVRRDIDIYIDDAGLDMPLPTADELADMPVPDTRDPARIEVLDIDSAGISTVIWATGFKFDFTWIDEVPLDAYGYPVTQGGESPMHGLFFCGLNWMTRRKSGIIYGVAADAKEVALRIGHRHRQKTDS